MALAWIDNELFLDYGGVTIYRLYKNDMQDNPLIFHFGFSPAATEVEDDTFDVRGLPNTFTEISIGADEETLMREVMRQAIDSGHLKMPRNGGAPCAHDYSLLEVAEDEKGLYVLCARCGATTRDLKAWTEVEDGKELQQA